jgi:hypothetical protein
MRLYIMSFAEMLQESIRVFERAGLICANADDLFPYRFVVKKGIKLDHTMHVCKRDVKQFRDFTCYLFWKPAVKLLGRMQRRQKPGAAQRDIRFNRGVKSGKVYFRH